MTYLTLTPDTLPDEHICCAFSDKKCRAGYDAKKRWLTEEFAHGYRFHRLDARGKVFLEYGPGAATWLPVEADNWMMLGCFWVSGKFKKQGHGKALLDHAQNAATTAGLSGLAAVVGRKKFHFSSDGKWLIRQGFREVDRTESGFSLLVRHGDNAGPDGANPDAPLPRFNAAARHGQPATDKGICVYYANRCPFTDYHVEMALRESCAKRGLPLEIHKIDSLEAARAAPSPATIFSLFLDGTFVTTDISACLDSRLDKVLAKARQA
ncbi:YoaP domain-containing protein [Aliiroseovarius crassostreae]|uniref:YoaP domain-containing protein n=1 Tax=Aliiroseovarius crassostreae TaxID=154981 RepID=UPI003C7A185C